MWFKSKDKKLKANAASACIAACTGITEPVIYGVNLPKKKPFVAACIASGIAGALVGILGAKRYIPGGLGLFGLPGYIDAGGTGLYSMWVVLVASIIAFVIALGIGLATYKEDVKAK